MSRLSAADRELLEVDIDWGRTVPAMDRVERLLQQQADTAFLVGAAYGRDQERERIARDLQAVNPVEWALAGQDAGNDAVMIVRQA